MISIVIPTLEPERAAETAKLATTRAGIDCRAIVVHDEGRCGYTRAVNVGLAQAEGGDVCLLVDDCVPGEGWLRALVEAAETRASLGVWFAGPSGPCRTPPQNGGRVGDLRRPRLVPHLAGFCLYVRRACIEQLGGLDEAFIHYASDVDWQRRARRDYGATSLWVPGVYVDHGLHPPHREWWIQDQARLREIWD